MKKIVHVTGRLMRLSVYILSTICCTSAALLANHIRAQGILEKKISIELKEEVLKDALDKVSAKAGIAFNYAGSRFLYTGKVNLKAKRKTVKEVLDELLRPWPLSYTEYEGSVFLKHDPVKSLVMYKTGPSYSRQLQQVMLQPRFVLKSTRSQPLVITGKVTDAETGEGLPGVSVVLKGSNTGTSTDVEGNYALTIPRSGADGTLVFSLMGYLTREIPAGDQKTLNIALERDIASLDEVVVVGYGTVRKGDLTGAVSSIRTEDFNRGVNTSVEQLIQGKIAGARIVTNSGEPGGGLSISIRGASSINAGTEPLFVIDGLPVANSNAVAGTGLGFPGTRSPRSPLNVLNTSDIESIEILKDASATAIYGARGANGVILITTKKGREGKAAVSYDGYIGVQNAANKLDMLNPQEYQAVVNDIIADGGGPPEQQVSEIAGGGTDWQEKVYQENALVHNHNISVSGGTKVSRYYVSFNHQDQDGVIINSGFKKYGLRFNLDSEVSDKLTLGLNVTGAYTRDSFAPSGYAINENGGILYTAIYYDPTLPVRDSEGNYFVSPYLTIENPLALAEGMDSYANNYSLIGTAFGEYKITPDLSAKLTLGGDAVSQRRDSYISKITQRGLSNGGIATIQEGQQSNYLVEASLTYRKTIQDHQFNLFAGATTQKFTTVRSSQSARNFATETTKANNIGLGAQETFDMGSDKFNNKLISYIGRANYSLKDKYLFTATFRADGSSRFGENNKFGYFPSFAGAWKVSEEGFLNGTSWLNSLKVRASWGRTGNQSIGNFQSIPTLNQGSPANFDQKVVVSLSPTRIANPDLKWETTEQWDLGLDFGFIGDRISGSIDYYRKKTFDMLLALPVPLETGFETILSNVGRIDNQGIDISLSTVNISSGDFNWKTTATLSTIKNEVKDLGGIPQIITGGAGFTGQVFVIREGASLRSFYGHQIDGIWQENDDFSVTTDNVHPGDLKFHDFNGDKTVNSDDRVILGDGFPDFTFSIGNDLSYKNLNLNIFIEGVRGVEMLNNNLVDTYFPIQLRRNKLAEPYLNRWTPENPSGKYPSFVTPAGQGRKAMNSYTVEDASYIRLKSVSLSYTFPKTLNKLFRNLTVFITGENLLTLTDYSGIDPGVNSNGTANTNIDFNTYPISRTFMAGLRIDF